MLLVSPAEPPALRNLGVTSSECEERGADFLFTCPHGLVGLQRKEVRDLVASLHGDRLAREIGQSTDLYRTVLLVEGSWRWDSDGMSQAAPGFTRAQWDGFLLSVQEIGWYVVFSQDLPETIDVIRRTVSWFQKADHNSLRQRPKSNGLWGSHTNKEWGIHWWQSFNGIGVTVATSLYEHVGVPVCWTVTEKELLGVPGIGKKRAKELMAALDSGGMIGGERKEE